MKKKSLKKIGKWILTGGLIFVAAMAWSLVYLEVRAVRFNDALAEYELTLAESDELRARHIAELKGILVTVLVGTTPSEDALIQRRLSRIVNAREAADDKLAKAKQKFCDLAGEVKPLCQEKQSPALLRGWLI